jgi:putative DNA primase/helicase
MLIDDFLKFLKSVDCCPNNVADIICDDVRRYYTPKNSTKKPNTCSYQLAESKGFGFGWVMNFRTGEKHVYRSTQRREWTEDQKEAFRAEKIIQDAKREKEEFERYEKAAVKAQTLYKQAKTCENHAYADRKKLLKNKIKTLDDNILIPRYYNGEIVNLETIDPTGFKLPIKDARMKGTYSFITEKGLPKDTLIICEGYATGDALFQCLNIPVIVAFTAGNLTTVAKDIRARYPDSKIIIAADNDQWTNVRGKPYNTGRVEGDKACAAAGGAFITFPDIPNNDPDKRTDWSDIFLTEGSESVKIAFEGVLNQLHNSFLSDSSLLNTEDPLNSQDYTPDFNYIPEHMEGIEDYYSMYEPIYDDYTPKNIKEVDGDWRSKIIFNSKGTPEKLSFSNIKLYLTYHQKLRSLFCYDCFSHKITLVKCPPWEDQGYFLVREYVEDDTVSLRIELEHLGLKANKSDVIDAVKLVAIENKINPAQKYFKDLVWDGKNRLDKFLEYYFCANPDKTQPEDNPEYLSVIGKKWMVAAVKRVFDAGCKFDSMLVIEGDQGIGKSRALRMLCTFGKDEERAYFTDSIRFSEISKPDTVQKMWGCLVIEIAELSGLSKSDVNAVKNWITNQEDLARLPYDRLVQKFKRQCVFAGTTNNYDYLTDTTGNRRFWCFKSHGIEFDELERDRDQLWAEAYELYKQKYPIYLRASEAKLAEAAQHKRLYSDPWEMSVAEIAYKFKDKEFTIKDILSDLGILIKDQTNSHSARARGVLEKMGFEKCHFRCRETKKQYRGYRKAKGFDV